MPHLVILYTGQLENKADMNKLCRKLADAMLSVKDESGSQVFPTGGTRVLAYPAAHYAVADGGAAGIAAGGDGDYGFVYLNLRMGRGRSQVTQDRVGEALLSMVKQFFSPLMETAQIGITLQIDVGQEVFDAKFSNLHPHFAKS